MRLVQYTYPTFRRLSPFAQSPWGGLDAEISRLFDSAFTDAASHGRFPVDLYEDSNNTYVRAELPGVSREEINVEVADGYLSINATRKTPAANGQPEQSRALQRAISVADDVQADKVTAQYENGVLTVTLPKREEAKPKKIAVAVK